MPPACPDAGSRQRLAPSREQLFRLGNALDAGPDATVIAHGRQECLLLRRRSSARAFHLQREQQPLRPQHAQDIRDSVHAGEAQQSSLAVILATNRSCSAAILMRCDIRSPRALGQ
jgi:hypothetical protein